MGSSRQLGHRFAGAADFFAIDPYLAGARIEIEFHRTGFDRLQFRGCENVQRADPKIPPGF